MQHNRYIRLSIREHVKNALANPGADSGLAPYNVYGENSLPGRRPNFHPDKPYIYLVDASIQPTETALPMVIVDINPISLDVTEVGRIARYAEVSLHVLGRNRGERDDLASYLQTYMATSGSGYVIPVYRFSGSGNELIDTGQVLLPVDVHSLQPIPEYRREEASTANENVVTFRVRFKTQ